VLLIASVSVLSLLRLLGVEVASFLLSEVEVEGEKKESIDLLAGVGGIQTELPL